MIKACNPKATLPVATTMQRRTMKLYNSQLKLRDERLDEIDCKVSFAIDIWTSKSSTNIRRIYRTNIDLKYSFYIRLFANLL